MSGARWFACANDMIFVCPRSLSAVLRLIELDQPALRASVVAAGAPRAMGHGGAVGLNAAGRGVLPGRGIYRAHGVPSGMAGRQTSLTGCRQARG